MRPQETIIYYLLYGFAFIAMGLAAWLHQKDEQISNLSLANALPDLAAFGVIHGMTEWMTMLLFTGLYSDLVPVAVVIRSFLKVLSFVFFLRFGMRVLWHQKSIGSFWFWVPWLLFAGWITGLWVLQLRFWGISGSADLSLLNTLVMRYGMALPAGIITFAAFHRDARLLKKKHRHKQALYTRLLSVAFLFYGLLDGLVVREAAFFPASFINHALFLQVTGMPVQLIKAGLGVLILWGLTHLLKAFREEAAFKIHQMVQERAAVEERRRIGMTLHDGIIQKLYASGLKVSYVLKQQSAPALVQPLTDVQDRINESMEIVRELLNQDHSELMEPEALMVQIRRLVEEYRQMTRLNIHLASRIPPLQLGKFSPEQSTHLYYILQEALCNIVKHADASQVQITLEATLATLVIQIRDNGQGFQPTAGTGEGKGLALMRQRAREAGGSLEVKSTTAGTLVSLQIPWEE
ncbi:sensor histidine kinase [Anoxynatronum buryatiense]|uniref:Oxygen sensor histidine kinase NreB n=1 Tax=Anoxynatronum buryatiense TaxID=489973 RepID=A0AA45WVM3_9CLOT|nr:sensor histidine kinase [Anoxynatronum buryatiense]SMP54579.1 Signal transduction histidine kinase [Anoxynatronum buryatiense]